MLHRSSYLRYIHIFCEEEVYFQRICAFVYNESTLNGDIWENLVFNAEVIYYQDKYHFIHS